MSLTRNNLLFYYAPLTTIGGVNSVQAAIGVVSKFEMLVVKPHTGGDLTALKKIILGLKQIDPGFKVFGYTDLGNAANLAAWEALVTQWTADLPTGFLDGIFIDAFGYDFATSTRANQNAALTTCHGASLSAFVSATSLIDVFGILPSEAAPIIGRSTTVRDYVLLNNFFYNNDNSATPSLESKEQLTGRLKYVNAAKKKPNNQGLYNISTAGLLGAGTATQVPVDAYTGAVTLAGEYSLDYLAVSPYDVSATSYKYFYKNRPNTFAD